MDAMQQLENAIDNHFASGEELAKKGMKKVLDKEMQAWVNEVYRRVISFYKGHRFTIEEIEGALGAPPRHFNAAGAILHNLARAHLIVWNGEVKRSKKQSRRNSLIRVWVRQ